jgi:uncharacterized membrane protein YcaP (DUF421 family)
MVFNGWGSLGRTLVIGLIAYISLILLLRTSGKRTLSKMNAFDLVVTIALGSTLATVILSKTVALVEGVASMALLIACQYMVTWLSVRSNTLSRLVRAEPTMLVYNGTYLRDAMRSQRVTELEIRQAIRSNGASDLSGKAVILENDGTFSVIPIPDSTSTCLIDDVDLKENKTGLK